MRITKASISFLLLMSALFITSCKQDRIFGDTEPNTDRPIIEFSDPHGYKLVAMDYKTSEITIDITVIRFMVRSYIMKNATVKIMTSASVVNEYNTANGTSYTSVPFNLYSFETTEFVLSPEEREKRIRIRIKPSDIALGEYAIGLTISDVSLGEISQIAGKLVVSFVIKNKYDGKYHLKGFYTRTDFPAYHGPFETDVEMITTGPNSVAMFWTDAGDYYQPFANNGTLTAFTNVAPEVYFNATDQANSIVNYSGDPVTGPFMTVFPGANSRYVPGTTPVIYLKYYYNTNPANRIFADTLIYTGVR